MRKEPAAEPLKLLRIAFAAKSEAIATLGNPTAVDLPSFIRKQLPPTVAATSLSAEFCEAKGLTLASHGLQPVDPCADQKVIALDIAPTAGDANEGELRK